MQKGGLQSKTKIVLIASLVVLFSLAMLITSVVQIVQINKLNDKIARQEQEIERLNQQYDEYLDSL